MISGICNLCPCLCTPYARSSKSNFIALQTKYGVFVRKYEQDNSCKIVDRKTLSTQKKTKKGEGQPI